MLKFCVLLFILTSNISGNILDGDLKFVVVLYRHGDRTPTKTYPKDPYANISRYWPGGLGQLTNLGILHQYELGRWFRNRYSNFLPETFSTDDIYVRSSDKDRTLMSASANLAGLYPPKDPQIWSKDLLWRPIPIHTVPCENDEVIAMKRKCPKYDILYDQLLESNLFRDINSRNKQLYNYLSEKTGWNITDLELVESIYSILSIEEEYNLTLPGWTSTVFPNKLKFLAAFYHASFSFTEQLARLKNGPFFDYMFTHFDNIVNSTSNLKFLMLSAHDNTIVNILSAMKLYDYTSPDFASSIIWELKKSKDKFYVNMFYKNRGTVLQLKLSGCETNCDYTKFKSLLQPVTVNTKNWEKECIISDP